MCVFIACVVFVYALVCACVRAYMFCIHVHTYVCCVSACVYLQELCPFGVGTPMPVMEVSWSSVARTPSTTLATSPTSP